MIAFDVSTTYGNRWAVPHGIARVEQEIIRALLTSGFKDIAYFRHLDTTHSARMMSAHSVQALIAGTHQSPGHGNTEHRQKRSGENSTGIILDTGKRLERALRVARKRLVQTTLTLFRDFPRSLQTGQGWVVLTGRNWRSVELAKRYPPAMRIACLVHDILPVTHEEFSDPAFYPYFEFATQRADRIFTVSDFCRSQILNIAPKVEDRLEVIDLGMDHLLDRSRQAPRRPRQGVPPDGRFLLSVGMLSKRKNQGFLLDVVQKARRGGIELPELLIVGNEGDIDHANDLHNRIRETPELRNRVRMLGRMNDAELIWLYQNCAAFLYPSLAEGWGMPVTEAVGFGKPVEVSDRTSVPEATLGFGQIVPLNHELWVAAIADTLKHSPIDNPAELQSTVARRTWRRCIDTMISSLRSGGPA